MVAPFKIYLHRFFFISGDVYDSVIKFIEESYKMRYLPLPFEWADCAYDDDGVLVVVDAAHKDNPDFIPFWKNHFKKEIVGFIPYSYNLLHALRMPLLKNSLPKRYKFHKLYMFLEGIKIVET